MAINIAQGTGPASQEESGSGVSTVHPLYEEFLPDWERMRDTNAGSRTVKGAGITYLPKPSGFAFQKDKGADMYDGYVNRAQFPEVVSATILGMGGVIHRMEAKIEMPEAMQPLWENCTQDGMTLEALHRRITYELLTQGRYALLVDVALGGAQLPYIAPYSAEALINWSTDKDFDFFVLDEETLERNGFRWEILPRWRVLQIDATGQYMQSVYEGADERKVPDGDVFPNVLGGARLTEIPFVVAGALRLSTEPQSPPLIGVANSAISYYQLSADYRHQLYMSGQETLLLIGIDPPDFIGAGSVLAATLDGTDKTAPPDAKYITPQCTGIDAHKEAMSDELQQAARSGARLFEQSQSGQESGDARRIRYAAETATLTTIAINSAAALERALRFCARFMGLKEEDVVVTPNLSFVDMKLDPQDAVNLVKMWQDGAISYETLYDNLQKGEIASAERSAEDEMKIIDKEVEERNVDPNEAGGLPEDTEEDPNIDPEEEENTDDPQRD